MHKFVAPLEQTSAQEQHKRGMDLGVRVLGKRRAWQNFEPGIRTGHELSVAFARTA